MREKVSIELLVMYLIYVSQRVHDVGDIVKAEPDDNVRVEAYIGDADVHDCAAAALELGKWRIIVPLQSSRRRSLGGRLSGTFRSCMYHCLTLPSIHIRCMQVCENTRPLIDSVGRVWVCMGLYVVPDFSLQSAMGSWPLSCREDWLGMWVCTVPVPEVVFAGVGSQFLPSCATFQAFLNNIVAATVCLRPLFSADFECLALGLD